MEADRAEADLGIAADIEQAAEDIPAAPRQPKKRFIGRRQAVENALNGRNDGSGNKTSSEIQGISRWFGSKEFSFF